MIEIVDQENRAKYTDEIEAMFRMRYKVAVEGWKWNIPNVTPGYDKDQFDTDDTIYFLAYDDERNLIGCGRLNPTITPHLLSDVFAEQCDFEGIPQEKDIFEFSRFIVDKGSLTHSQAVQYNLEICLAVTEYSVANGINQLTWLAYKSMYTKSVVLWKTRPLGAPKYYEDDDSTYIAAIIDTTPLAVKRIRRFCRASDPKIVCLGSNGMNKKLPSASRARKRLVRA